MMFDFTSSSPKGLTQAREAARAFVEQLHPSDLVSVASYTTDKGAEVLLQFTGALWYVPVLIEVDGRSLTAGVDRGAIPADIYAYAFDHEGRVRDFFSQTVSLDLAKVGPALERLEPAADGSNRLVAIFAPPAGLKPGDYLLMVTLTDSAGVQETSVTPFQVAGG